ncbi:hypothetical protein [Pedobacter frigidisoli]|uniref:hypothetical protein n=1 Tax=Pedobacter frigidisoli TaxID=2530455 RepID=UPI002930E51F|nr:hypothetical protein [Pedobacter frigidisoli]
MTPQKKTANVNWADAYRELSQALMTFSKEHKHASGPALYARLRENKEFLSANPWLQRFDATETPSVDPITIFASFNDSRLKDKTRTDKLNHYLKILGAKQVDGIINYDGCPTPITTRIIAVRTIQAQVEIWTLFRSSQNYKPELNKKIFSLSQKWYGLDVASITIFLFWVRPKFYLPLDKNTVEYLLLSGQISSRPKTYEEYTFILNIPLGDHIEFSKLVYRAAHENDNVATENLIDKTNDSPSVKRIRRPHKLLAIRFDKKMKEFPSTIKTLETDKTYQFYQCYDFSDLASISYDPNKDVSFYFQGDLEISISAIVGKNGSGKSTLTELLYAAINNLSQKHPSVKKKEIQYVKDIYLEFFYLSTFLHRIVISGDDVLIFRYENAGTVYNSPSSIDFGKFELEEFFYTLAINYAHYGLNSNHLGMWIHHIFHKNDGYEMPITISPYRKKGNIDINSEMELVKSRLLSLLLQPIDETDYSSQQESLRTLKKGKIATSFKIKVEKEKIEKLFDVAVSIKKSNYIYKAITLKDARGYWKTVLKTVCKTFGIEENRIPSLGTKKRDADFYAFAYIIKKLISITIKYPRDWGKYFNVNTNTFNKHSDYISLLSTNYSHVTFKLRQAINFLKYDHISKHLSEPNLTSGTIVSIDLLSKDIQAIIGTHQSERLKIPYLVPPPFLATEIFFEKAGDSFDSLSSGEKQRIYSVTTLAYHLINLDSVPIKKGVASYSCINVVFDEVELYFHPEMQRTFISFMLWYLKKIQLGDGLALNICFITHSPFILSDIPNNNILFLDDNTKGLGTFGANIHELLSSSFFLNEGFMGAYAQWVISDLALYLSPEKEKPSIKWTEKTAENAINIIGEPLIQRKLRELYREKFKLKLSREERISELKIELIKLENEKNN